MQVLPFIRLLSAIVLCLFSLVNTTAQTKKIDSLKNLLSAAEQDSLKIKLLYKIGEEYWVGLEDTIDIENCLKYTNDALSLSRKTGFTSGIINGLMCKGNVNAYLYNLPESKNNFNEAAAMAQQQHNSEALADIYFEIADDYFTYGNDAIHNIRYFPLAVHYYFKALKSYEDAGNKYRTGKSWFYIGRTYAWQNFFNMGHGNAAEIERCVMNARSLFKESGRSTAGDFADCNFLQGRANYFLGRYSTSLQFLKASLYYAKDSSIKSVLANNYLNIGRAYKGIADSAAAIPNHAFAEKMYDSALHYFTLSLDLNKTLRLNAFIALGLAYIGELEVISRQYVKARQHLDSAIVYTQAFNGGTFQEIYRNLATIDSAEGKYKQALVHFNLYMKYKEMNINNASVSESLNYRTQYEFEKREDSLKQRQLLTETKLKAEKKQKYFYLAGLSLLALLCFFIYLTFRNQKKIIRLEREKFAREKAEMELHTLLTQLNPHFIFNCISSIDGLIQNNERHNATNYLNKFARLMRSVLENSRENTVSFSKDIETLKLYLDLEQLRNEDKYATSLMVPAELMTGSYIVPPLVIQPFVENAIKHGLKNKPGKNGLLNIEVKRSGDYLVYTITDNGVGRKASATEIKNHHSLGLHFSTERIRIFNNEETASVSIEDLFTNGEPSGTSVTVKLTIK